MAGRRLGVALVVVAVAIGAAAWTGASGPRASLSAPPAGLYVGRPWLATLTVTPKPAAAPVVSARLGTRTASFRSSPLGRNRYRVRFVFPAAGRWALSARIGKTRRPLRTVVVRPPPPPTSPIPGGTAFRVCGGDGQPYTQYALAVGFGSAWVACTSKSQVRRYDAATGRQLAAIPVGLQPWSLTAGSGGVWALSRNESTVVRIDPATNRVVARIPIDSAAPYLWAASGAVWVGDDVGHALPRIDPATNRVVAKPPVGDGPAGVAGDGASVWVLNHRESTLDRIDVATNKVTRLGGPLEPPGNAAVERIALLNGSLWASGRGADLLRVSPSTGAVLGRTEIGAGGIGVVTDGTHLDVVGADDPADAQGFPIVGFVHRIDPSSAAIIDTRRPTRRLFANGTAAADGQVWIVDTVAGLLVRLPG